MLDKLKNLYRWLSPRYQTVYLDYAVQPVPRFGHGKPSHPELKALLERGHHRYAEVIAECLKLSNDFDPYTPHPEKGKLIPAWYNGFFPGLDSVVLHTLLATRQPRRYVEVGSGNSTRVAAHAIATHRLATRITSIDPFPRAEMDQLAHHILRQPMETVDPAFFQQLEPGDILFIDNSHRALPNSDVTVFFLEVLPRLKPGVVVQVHDIFLPDDYSPEQAARFYSEQYLLAAMLLAGPDKFEVLFPCWYVSQTPQLSSALAPLWAPAGRQTAEHHGVSFWFTVR